MIRHYIAKSLAALLLATTSLAANAAAIQQNPAASAASGLTVKVATIAAGRLVILGTASRPGARVKIEGTTLTALANAQRLFRFDVDYRTPDCRLTLATATGKVKVLVSECGPAGVVPRGAWTSNRKYAENDLVIDEGSTYRSLRPNVNRRPTSSRSDWQLFTARGAAGVPGPRGRIGPQGVRGVPGPAGAEGPQGAAGPSGPQGLQGVTGPQGPVGAAGPGVLARGPWALATGYSANDLVTFEGSTWRALRTNVDQSPSTHPADWVLFAQRGADGPQGPVGPVGPQGPQGDPGIDGAQGPVGPAGADGAQGPAGPAGANGLDGADGAQGPMGPAGPQGPQGDPGIQGPAGPQGSTGATGATGATGPSGSTLVQDGVGTSTASNASAGTVFTDTATCPAGKLLLGGGGSVVTTAASQNQRIGMIGSYPSTATTWTVTGIVETALSSSNRASATAYALCSQ